MTDPGSRLERIFADALELTAEERPRFLDEACAGDVDLRRELDELLAVEEAAGAYFSELSDTIRATSTLELDTAARPRIQLGAYRAEEAIGRGGMGIVYRGRRVEGDFEQEVALKLLHLDMHTPEMQRRFVAERRLLARLEHRHIARLLDGGVTDEDRPYIVMELVDGRPITAYCRDRRLALDATLRLFLQVVDAVSYLHRNLVVHRDLKPSNLLVRADGEVKLLDFGIAKLLTDDQPLEVTVTGRQLLTPQYAAPEQHEGGAVTTATDVFSLGAVLYELLAGRPLRDPGAPGEPTATAPGEALGRAIAADFADGDLPPWRRLPRDLDDICMQALRPEPERRYASAEQLGRDIERHLEGLPVAASGDSLGYRMNKLVRRRWKGLLSATLALALLVVGLIRERGLRDRAEAAALHAEAVTAFLSDLVTSADPARAQGSEVTVKEVLDRADERLQDQASFAGQPTVEAQVRLILGRTYAALGRGESSRTQLEEALRLAGGRGADSRTAVDVASLLARSGLVAAERREQLARWVIAVRGQDLGPDHPDVLDARSALAAALHALGRKAETEAIDREVYEAWLRVAGRRHVGTVRAANSLAADHFEAARYAEAAVLYAEALEVARDLLGPSHPQTLRLIANLGTTYSSLGRYADAELLQREVVAEQIRVLGESHPRTGLSMHNLGLLQLRLGRPEAAEGWFRRAVPARAGGGAAGQLYSKSFLANTVRDLGRWEEAEELYREILEAQRDAFGADHQDTLRTVANFAELKRLRGDFDGAAELATGLLEPQSAGSGTQQLDASDTHELLARIRLDQGRVEDAREHAGRMLELRAEVFPAEHPVMLGSHLLELEIDCASGIDASAELDRLTAELAAALGPEHPRTAAARELNRDCGGG